MKKITLIISCVLFYFISYSQIGFKESDMMREVKTNQFRQNQMKKSKLNFFLDQTWQGGVVFSKDEVAKNGYLFRYNIYTDQIEYRTIVNTNTVDIVSIGSQKFVFLEFLTEDSMKNKGYFELLVNGDCKLLLRRTINYSKGRDDIEAYGASSSTNVKKKLYIKKGDNPAVMIERSKKDLEQILSDKEQAVDYINDQLIIFLNEKRIKDIVEFYNNI